VCVFILFLFIFILFKKNVSVIQGGGEQLSSLVTTEVDAIRVERGFELMNLLVPFKFSSLFFSQFFNTLILL
jgi:hypothetical protein